MADSKSSGFRALIAQSAGSFLRKVIPKIFDAGSAGEDNGTLERLRKGSHPQREINTRPAKPQRQQGDHQPQTTLPQQPGTQPLPEQPYQPPINQPAPAPEPIPNPFNDPEFEKQREQAERDRLQRERQEKQQAEREQAARDRAEKKRATRELEEKRESDEKRRESDKRQDKIIEDLENASRETREFLERSRRKLPFSNSPFNITSSYALQINSSSREASFGDKISRAILLSMETGVLQKEVLESMRELLTPESLAAMGGFIALVGSANLAAAITPPIGPAVAAVVNGAMAVLIVGGNADTLWKASTALAGFLVKANGAKTDAEFLAAAKDFAKFANAVGPDVVSRMTGAAAGKALGNIASKLASIGGELAGLSPERQRQIKTGLEAGRNLLNSVGKNIQDGFKNVFKSIDDALKHLKVEKKANSLTNDGDGKLPSGNDKKPDKPKEAPTAEFPAGSPIKAKPAQNPALKTSTNMQDWIILNIDKRLAEKQAALNKLATAKTSGKSTRDEIEKINKKIDQADDALVNAGATWKLAEEGVDIIEFEKQVPRLNKPGAAAEADIAGRRWWVETGNGTQGKLDQIIKALSNSEANKDRKSLIAYIPKFSDAAVKQITDAGGYVARDYQELSRLVKQAEKGELPALNSASALGRQFKAVLKKDKTPDILPFDFKTLDSALNNAVTLDKDKSGIKYGYIVTKQDSKILIPGKSKATVLPIPGRDNQGVIVKFTPGKDKKLPYTIELMTGQAAPKGLVDGLLRNLNLSENFRKEMKSQENIPKGIHYYEGVITKGDKSISEELSKEVYTAQAQPTAWDQLSVGEQLRARMDTTKLALGWVGNEPSTRKTADSIRDSGLNITRLTSSPKIQLPESEQPSVGQLLQARIDAKKLALGWVDNQPPSVRKPAGSISDSSQKIRMLTESLNRQNRLRQALINQSKELELLELNEAHAQLIAKASEISMENNKPRPRQNQREM